MAGGVFENFPYTNFHDVNLDWILKKMGESVAQIEEFKSAIEVIQATYEKSADITNKRKLSPTGNLTGSLAGRAANLVLANIDSNRNQIEYIANQFSDGQTGTVIDGGFFEDSGIRKNYNGGMF
jgi:hypothetical protein